MKSDQYTYRVTWSEEDGEYVGLCAEFPSLSWLAHSPDAALKGFRKQFEQFLIDNHVNELYLVGVDAAYCVYYSALGALNRVHKATVITDAVLSRKKMADVLERYRRKDIAVITSEQLISKV